MTGQGTSPGLVAAATGSATVSDAATNTLTDVFVITHATSATAAAGFSAGLLFRGENSAGAAMDIARISANEAGVSPGSEKGGLDFWVRTGGAALSKKWALAGSGNWVVDTDNAYSFGSNTLRLAASNAVSFRVHGAAGDVNRVAELSTFGLGLGQGGATSMDWYLAHATVVSRADMASGNILGAVGAGGFHTRTLAADAQPTASLSGSTLQLGAGGASAPDVRVRRTAAKTLTFDDGAGGAITVAGLGGGAFTAPPVAANWTQKGATAATLTDLTVQGSACLLVTAPGTTQDRWIRNVTLGSTWQVSAAFAMKPNNGGGGHESLYGLAISGGGNEFIRFGVYALSTGARADGYDLTVQIQRHSALGSPGAAPFSISVGAWGTYQTLWLRAEQDGANIVYSISYDGYDWVTLYSESKTAYLTATEIGIIACDSVPNTTTSRLMSWVLT